MMSSSNQRLESELLRARRFEFHSAKGERSIRDECETSPDGGIFAMRASYNARSESSTQEVKLKCFDSESQSHARARESSSVKKSGPLFE